MTAELNIEMKNNIQISLNGMWEFTYTPQMEESEQYEIPDADKFETQMPVPGYWDDNIPLMQETEFWQTARFNPYFRHIDFPMGVFLPPDTSLPFLMGVGWYKKTIFVPSEWNEKQVSLYVGGVVLEGWVFVNGKMIKHHVGHSTPFEAELCDCLKYGEENEIIIAAANTRNDRLGCIIRGFKGFSAGLYRSVSLNITEKTHIEDCYIYPSEDLKTLNWSAKLTGDVAGTEFSWFVKDIHDAIIYEGEVKAGVPHAEWTTDASLMCPWSDKSPELYNIEINLERGGRSLHKYTQRFGLRRLVRSGVTLKLNGKPAFLRGTTEHAYFPLTCTPPLDTETYRSNIRKIKSLGFNWMRFHTWVPSEEYMNAADELGMLIQVEAPLGFEEPEWVDILRTCRKHPSVVIYCCGNEEQLTKAKIEYFRKMAQHSKALAPDALFNPHEAMRGIEYGFGIDGDDCDGVIDVPFKHNPKRLQTVREFSDVFGQYPMGQLSYFCIDGNWRTLNEWLKVYERPCLSHEVGILGSYINLDLEHRYDGTRIGTEIYASVRKCLNEAGLLGRAATYYNNSCAWMKILRKHVIETARKCSFIAGYDYLGVIDYHWHRCGYPCGIMNEFFEMKPGESAEDVLKYNDESVLLLDYPKMRNVTCGEKLTMELYVSLFGEEKLGSGRARWHLEDSSGQIYQRTELEVSDIATGGVSRLPDVRLEIPKLAQPLKLTLYADLSGGVYEISNSWDFWAFPEAKAEESSNGVKVVSELTSDTIAFVENGGSCILLGSKPFPALPVSFQISLAGRVKENLATVIEEHPLMNRFPHDGFCDWQFYSMLEGAKAVVFNELPIAFKPILEIVSSFKLIRKQAAIFELCVGKGKLLVCTLNIKESDPAAAYLLNIMKEYAAGDEFNPTETASAKEIMSILNTFWELDDDFTTDRAIDPNAVLKCEAPTLNQKIRRKAVRL